MKYYFYKYISVFIPEYVSDLESDNAALDEIAAQYPSCKVAAAVFNAGGLVRKPFPELTEQDYSIPLSSQAYVSFHVFCSR
jgi:predicted MarR family transcription regulator